MRNTLIIRKLITAVAVLGLLVYFMCRTPSARIIFIPFLFCSIASIGKHLSLLFDKKRAALFFDRLFKGGFFLFWFGFLLAAGYIAVRDRHYGMLLYSVPFWLAGIFFLKRKFPKNQ